MAGNDACIDAELQVREDVREDGQHERERELFLLW